MAMYNSRRRTLLYRGGMFGLVALTPGCGFHPIYGSTGGGRDGPAQDGLAATQISNIASRPGQLLRQALQSRFERGGAGVSHRYELYVAFGIGQEGISVQQDNSIARNRLIGTATWSLFGQDPGHSTLTSGIARSVDGTDVVNEQFFAADLGVEAAQRRICEAVADQITLDLAGYFMGKAGVG
jgi:LPS-assembly lipoprotein